MNTPRILLAAATVVVLGGVFTAASARDLSGSADVVRDSVAGHAYQNGGVSHEEVIDMRSHLKPYDLRLAFTQGRHGAYVADVKLRITDADGKRVFALKDAGPLTDVKLPAGHYNVVGQLGGVKQRASVDVKPDQPASLTLHWLKDVA